MCVCCVVLLVLRLDGQKMFKMKNELKALNPRICQIKEKIEWHICLCVGCSDDLFLLSGWMKLCFFYTLHLIPVLCR
jgi:hypothetical protein